MERLFSPCTRLHDILESPGERLERFRRSPGGLQELNLDVSTEEFLTAERGFTYADLYDMLANESMVVWLTPHAAVMPERGRVVRPFTLDSWEDRDELIHFPIDADGKVIDALAPSPEHLVEICDVLLRLLAASVVHSVTLHKKNSLDGALISSETLAYLMEQCQSLKVLTLICLDMDENHCRVLGTYSRPDLEIEVNRCIVTSAGARALVEAIGRNQGPTKLERCDIDDFVLADGLRGNSHLKSLRPRSSFSPEDADRQLLAIAGALRDNKGLVDLNLSSCWVSDETWNAICDSLKTHPTLEVLDFRVDFTNTTQAPVVLKSRIQALTDMMKVNTSIHTLQLYLRHVLFRGSVIPYLDTNRLRPRVRAIQKALPSAYRAKVLGRALLSARTDPNRFWILLSGNADTATTTRAPRFYRRIQALMDTLKVNTLIYTNSFGSPSLQRT
jgi:hypothetical protein